MGNVLFCSCNKTEDDGPDESAPLISSEDGGDEGNGERVSRETEADKFYKSVVDDAQGKFLNSSFRHHHSRTREDSNAGAVQELRAKLSAINIDEAQLNSLVKEDIKWRNDKSASSVVDLLSEPLSTSSLILDVDRVTDEVAELVSQHVHIRIDDSNATVVSFKPVSSSST